MGPSQEAKASPWRQASSSSSCLRRAATRVVHKDRELMDRKLSWSSWQPWLNSCEGGAVMAGDGTWLTD